MEQQISKSKPQRWFSFIGITLVINLWMFFPGLMWIFNFPGDFLHYFPLPVIYYVYNLMFWLLSFYLILLFVNRSERFTAAIKIYAILYAGLFIVASVLDWLHIGVSSPIQSPLFLLVTILLLVIFIWLKRSGGSHYFEEPKVKLSFLISITASRLTSASFWESFGFGHKAEGMTIECVHCGRSYPGNHKFCRACGKPLN